MKPNVHIKSLLKVLSQGVYEKEHIIAIFNVDCYQALVTWLLVPNNVVTRLW